MPLGLEYDTWYEYYDARPTSSVIKKGKNGADDEEFRFDSFSKRSKGSNDEN